MKIAYDVKFDEFQQTYTTKLKRSKEFFVYYLCCVITLLKTINHVFHGRIAEQNAIVCGHDEIKIIPIRFHSIHLT